ncbi:MAG: hypothetical protein QM571_04655 [Micrococcaceae bacterium]
MYGWIWRHLPGPLIFRILFGLLLLVAVLYFLMNYFFPWLSHYFPLSDPEVGAINTQVFRK